MKYHIPASVYDEISIGASFLADQLKRLETKPRTQERIVVEAMYRCADDLSSEANWHSMQAQIQEQQREDV